MNGSIYVLRDSFAREDAKRLILDSKIVLHQMYDTAVLDIDSEEDFEFMQIIADYLFVKKENFARMFEAAKALIRK